MNTYHDVLFEEITGKGGNLGLITLNRPEVLNSLNHAMINAIHAQLKKWAIADHIKAVIIRAAEGRAFCAGGDLRSTYERLRAHDASLPFFFRDEYQLNRYIFHFPKPYIALLDGITMGGGVGISIHGSHRVATDRLLFAMPETGIGFFPDVGGTYFLPRLSDHMGFYLGLTGIRITSDDCVALGIAQHKIPHEKLSELIHTLAQQEFSHDARITVTQIIDQFKMAINPSQLIQQRSTVNEHFSANTIEDIFYALRHSSDAFCQETLVNMMGKSPSSLKVTLHALQQGKQLHFDACMRQEFRLVCRFLQEHDFLEGIRAIIIDKDQMPRWQPSRLEEVTYHEVEKYFAPIAHELV